MQRSQPEYRLAHRLAHGQNLYDQPPFAGITQGVNSSFASFSEPGIRAHISLAADSIAGSFVIQPYPDVSRQLQMARECIISNSLGSNRLSKWLSDRGYPLVFNDTVIRVNQVLIDRLAAFPYWAVYVEKYVSPMGRGKQYIVDGEPNLIPSQRPKKPLDPAETYLSYLLGQLVRDERLKYFGLRDILPDGYPTEPQTPASPDWVGRVRKFWEQRIAAEQTPERRVR